MTSKWSIKNISITSPGSNPLVGTAKCQKDKFTCKLNFSYKHESADWTITVETPEEEAELEIRSDEEVVDGFLDPESSLADELITEVKDIYPMCHFPDTRKSKSLEEVIVRAVNRYCERLGATTRSSLVTSNYADKGFRLNDNFVPLVISIPLFDILQNQKGLIRGITKVDAKNRGEILVTVDHGTTLHHAKYVLAHYLSRDAETSLDTSYRTTLERILFYVNKLEPKSKLT